MIRLLAAGAAALGALAPAPALAAPLWENVEAGMAAERVRALWPAGGAVRHRGDRIVIDDFQVTERCTADVAIHLAGGSVDRVELRGAPALLGRCGAEVLETLVARHGAPDSERSRGETPWARSRSSYAWRRGGVAVDYTYYTSAGYAGSGLASASWVLVYSSGDGESQGS